MTAVHVVGQEEGAEAGFVKKVGMAGGQLECIPEERQSGRQYYRQREKEIREKIQAKFHPMTFIARKPHVEHKMFQQK
jgi:hypothetical protein